MHILLSNDDGVHAPGLLALHQVLVAMGDCHVVAPLQDMSGVSSALTLERPLYPVTLPNGFIALNGTPADCVHLGCNGLLMVDPDWVVSGINLGANLGDDVLYSGTVAAAVEAGLAGKPAFAFSLASRQADNLPTAAWVAARLLAEQASLHLPERTILSVNVPNLPRSHIKGIQLTRLGHRGRARPPVKTVNPRGKEGYWIAAPGDAEDGGQGTDFHALMQGYVSVTPLQLGRSCHLADVALVDEWLGRISL